MSLERAKELVREECFAEAVDLLEADLGRTIPPADIEVTVHFRYKVDVWRGTDDLRETQITLFWKLSSRIKGVYLADAWWLLRAFAETAKIVMEGAVGDPAHKGRHLRYDKISARTRSFDLPGSIGYSWQCDTDIWTPDIKRGRAR